jgi:predicted dehydrogenase
MRHRLIMGREGTMSVPGERSGHPPRVQRGDEELPRDALVEAVPDWSLREIEAKLFGSERPSSYSLSGTETDRKLIAAEMHDFAEAVCSGRAPEADGAVGLRSVALVASALESATAGRAVTVDEVLAGDIHAWQDTLEAAV